MTGASPYHGRHCKRSYRGPLTVFLIIAALASLVIGLNTVSSGPPAAALGDSIGVQPAAPVTRNADEYVLQQQVRGQAAKDHRPAPGVKHKPKPKPRPAAEAAAPVIPAPQPPAPAVTSSAPAVTSSAPAPAASPPDPAPAKAGLLAEAETQEGVPYLYGGDTPAGFDCSGLIYWSALQIGITSMPRDTLEMLGEGVASGLLAETSNPAPGDLAFFGSDHVELYVSPGEFFGAQKTGTLVGYHDYGSGYLPTAYYYVT